MNISLIGWSHIESLIVKNLRQPWHMCTTCICGKHRICWTFDKLHRRHRSFAGEDKNSWMKIFCCSPPPFQIRRQNMMIDLLRDFSFFPLTQFIFVFRCSFHFVLGTNGWVWPSLQLWEFIFEFCMLDYSKQNIWPSQIQIEISTMRTRARLVFIELAMSHSQMLGKVEYGLPEKIWRLVGCTEMLSW